jgi:pimeloyl-ACP methyl ester carboxylesterase
MLHLVPALTCQYVPGTTFTRQDQALRPSSSRTVSVVTRRCGVSWCRPSKTASTSSCTTLVGSGGAELSAYDRNRYHTLQGHADDLLEIIDTCAHGPVFFVGHSVSVMIGMLATIRAPERFIAQVMVGPSPCYINDGDYVGGFTAATRTGCCKRWKKISWAGRCRWRR